MTSDSVGGPTPPIALSVVVAAVEAEHTIRPCLAALTLATAGIAADIVVVNASTDDTGARARAVASVRVIDAPPGTLVPRLWSQGYHATSGEYVAFTLGQCIVATTWAQRLLGAMTPDTGGAGGAFNVGRSTRPVAWAIFFLRYSTFIDEQWSDGPVAGDIAGDNSLYRRQDLDRIADFEDAGFWELEAHRQLRARGLRLVAVRGATATVQGRPAATRVLGERFLHGRRFGASRVAGLEHPVRILAAAPLVPAVLLWRAARRVLPYSSYRTRFWLALPWMAAFASAWALGEAIGAWKGRRARE